MTTPRIIFIQPQNGLADPPRATWCESFLCRLRGLTFRRSLTRDEGLLLVFGRDSRVDSSIHMLGVKFDLAVFWINDKMQVVDKIVARAGNPAYFPKEPARYVLEVHASRIDDLAIGQTVKFQNA
jgi:uncharacterized membrane protein (UPF0127 family)